MKQTGDFLWSNKLLLSGYLILTAFIIIIPALYNGYPLFYSDSALYIKAAMLFGNVSPEDSVPYLSGLGYAFFIRIVTWKSTLYLVILAQAIILSILIYLSLRVLLPAKKILIYHLSLILLLSICSSMGWTTSQLMPDIFTSYLILSVFLFYTYTKNSWEIYIFLSAIIITSVLSHLTNISIIVLIIAALVLLFLIKNTYRLHLKLFIKKSIVILALVFSSLIILVGLNKKYYNYVGLSPTSYIFFFARLIDTGLMPEFLNEKCAEKSYEICQYKDNLPDKYESFLFGAESVFYKTGGWDLSKHNEYRTIARDFLTSPKYLGKFLYNCAIHSAYQLVTFKTGDGLTNVFNPESSQYQTVLKYYNRGEFKYNFQNSKQIQGTLDFKTINLINYILIFISVLIIIWTLLFNKLDSNMFLFTYINIFGVAINAAVTSSLSSVFDRFQSRVIWLIPLLASIYFFKFVYPAVKASLNKYSKTNHNL